MTMNVYKAIYDHIADAPNSEKAIRELVIFINTLYHDYEDNCFPKVSHD